MTGTRRAVLAGAQAAGVAALLSACAGGSGSADAGDARLQPSKAPVKLMAFLVLTDQQIARFSTEDAAPFHQQHPNITLEATPQPGAGGMQGVMEKLTS